MSDFPAARDFHKPVISSYSVESAAMQTATEQGSISGLGGSAVYPSANLALFVPFVLWAPYLVRTLWWANGTAVAGNVDCGVYASGGGKIVSAGSTAQAGTSAIQKVALGTPVLLTPGSYYMALSCSSATATFIRTAPAAPALQWCGMAQQATALPLPSAFTLASLTNQYLPLFGVAKQTVL